MNRALFYLWSIALAFLLAGCDLEQEVDIELPQYRSRIVVECYLEPGEPFTLLLSRSAPYFEPFPPLNQQFLDRILVDSAEVAILHQGKVYELNNQLVFNPSTNKIFNYFSPEEVPFDTTAPFELFITLTDGRSISATTQVLPVVPIDSVVVEFSESDTLARVLTYFEDDPSSSNFYRRTLHENSLDSLPEQDFTVDDRILEGTAVFGTAFNYTLGDTVITTLFHIDQSYFEFLESLEDALNANGNPFAQPSPIISGFSGTADAIGIFTGLSYDRKTVIVRD